MEFEKKWAEYKGKKVGSIGDAGCFSFCQNKTFTTGGEGGMMITDDEDTAWEARSFRDHGYDVKKRMSLLEMEQALPYIHRRVGFNYRMTEMQSAIGIKELEKLDSWNLPQRRKNGEILIAEGVYAWKEFWPQSYKEMAFTEHNGFGRFNFPFESREYTDAGAVKYGEVFCPNCAWLEERTFVVHIWPTIKEEHIQLVARAIKKVASAYAK